ncbi:hypothetical protein KAR91_02785 [Candidatus Pacearchaeota archaeon]|nr:hypothetical protein [Candidatus Pacearchaeota archaeon]
MMLYKKDFKRIAEIVQSNRGDGVEYVLDCVADDLADYLSTKSPNFDRDRFLAACGVN